jgi:hypothetical protein
VLPLFALLAVVGPLVMVNNDQSTTLLNLSSLGCDELEPLWLEAQSVPSASLVPCVPSLPAGWRFLNILDTASASGARNGWSMFSLAKYQAGALVVRLEAACDTGGAIEQPADRPGTRRYERTGQGGADLVATWYTVFPGGCVTAEFHSTEADAAFTNEARSMVDFTTRQALQQELERRTDGRLRLDPPPDPAAPPRPSS